MSRIEILSWNIQCARGMDGRMDMRRIAGTVLDPGRPDVICFQEVARHMPGVTAGEDVDQAAEFARLFEGFNMVFRPAVDLGHRQFGCMVLTRHPVIQVSNFLLPRPICGEKRSMRRQALEVTLDLPCGPIRLTTTHLEFNSPDHRTAQVHHLREAHREAMGRTENDGDDGGWRTGRSPYSAPPAAAMALCCGDFNFLPHSSAYRELVAGFDDGTPTLHDAWTTRYGDRPHPSTCGVNDHDQWPEGPHCRDYFFATATVTERVLSIDADERTAASDHQPIRLAIDGAP